MKRYVRLLVIYLIIAVALVVAYAPWALALRPWDFSLLRAGLSIIVGVALAGVFGASTYLTLKDPDVKLLEPSSVMDDDEVIPVLEEYADAPYVGTIAREATEQVRSAARKRGRLTKAISQQFSEGSISWDKFAGLVEKAERTVLRNAALIANDIQSFDRDGYARERSRAKASDKQSEALALFETSLADMGEVCEANERVLLEMGKLELELGKLASGDTKESAAETVDELQALIEDTRYYR